MASTFVKLTDIDGADEKRMQFHSTSRAYIAEQKQFLLIPGYPIAYWASQRILQCFSIESISKSSPVMAGISTGENEKFIFRWHEIQISQINYRVSRGKPFLRHNKGGEFRRWFGNIDYVLRYDDQAQAQMKALPGFRRDGSDYFGFPMISWGKVGGGLTSFRYYPAGFSFDSAGAAIVGMHGKGVDPETLLALNSILSERLLNIMNPTMNVPPGVVTSFPDLGSRLDHANAVVLARNCCAVSKSDWDLRETSWDFRRSPLLTEYAAEPARTEIDENLTDVSWPSAVGVVESLAEAYQSFVSHWTAQFLELHRLEEENNRIFIDLYGLQEELTPDVPYNEVTILQDELDDKARKSGRIEFKKDEVMGQFVSYGVGCIFGRYSLDKDGLILANAEDDLADYLSQISEPTLQPDESGILPITCDNDFADDLPTQWCAFVRAAFGDQHYEANLRFLEDGLGKRLRPYFLKGFYDDHVKRYKKRPIYWLITSPKGTLQALIYLHRYNRDTVNRFLNDYLRPYQQKLEAKRVSAEHVLTGGGSSQSEKTKAQKRIDEIRKALEELSTWERDVVRPLAEKRIELDLDDGVKVNYGKLGAILAKVKGLNA